MRKKITVLYYHEVVPAGQGYTYQKIEQEKFRQQMRWLKENGYETVTFSQLSQPLPEKPVIITFDDGFRSVYTYAAPILAEYGFQAVLYLAPKYIDEAHSYYMSWEQIRDLCSRDLAEVGAHTHSHIDVRSVSAQQLEQELSACDSSIAANLGIKPGSFCFPYGTFHRSSVRTLRSHGYPYLVASWFGRTPVKKASKRLVQRIGISDTDSMEMFVRKVTGKESYRGIVQLARILRDNLRKKWVTEYRIDF